MHPALFALFLTLFASWGASAHEPNAAAPVAAWPLQVQVTGKPDLRLDAEDFAKLPQSSVTAHTRREAKARWDGVTLLDLLRAAGAPVDKALHNPAMPLLIRVTGADGYQISIRLGELDPASRKQPVLVASHREGQPLDSAGPLRLVVPGDAGATRWVRNVQKIEAFELEL